MAGSATPHTNNKDFIRRGVKRIDGALAIDLCLQMSRVYACL